MEFFARTRASFLHGHGVLLRLSRRGRMAVRRRRRGRALVGHLGRWCDGADGEKTGRPGSVAPMCVLGRGRPARGCRGGEECLPVGPVGQIEKGGKTAPREYAFKQGKRKNGGEGGFGTSGSNRTEMGLGPVGAWLGSSLVKPET